MSFNGSLGYVQIASDFRVVTPLQQQVDDLLFPRSHLSKFFFHALHLMDCASWVAGGTTAPSGLKRTSGNFGSSWLSVVHPRGHSGAWRLQKLKNLAILQFFTKKPLVL
jgi:hypothetical protein